jgi:hypothetical protein
MKLPLCCGSMVGSATGTFWMLAAFAAQYAAFRKIVLSPDATPGKHRGLVVHEHEGTVFVREQCPFSVVWVWPLLSSLRLVLGFFRLSRDYQTKKDTNPSCFFDFYDLDGTEICRFCHAGVQVIRGRAFRDISL